MILTPRDWQAVAQLEASDLLGTPEGATKLAEAKRYGALADELERLQRELGECSGALELVGHPIEWQARIGAAVAAEREACALACEAEHVGADVCDDCDNETDESYNRALRDGATAIRERSNV